MASAFKYQPLNHNEHSIRILKVLPGLSSDTIQCELEHATIEATYICLSYGWGFIEGTIKLPIITGTGTISPRTSSPLPTLPPTSPPIRC